MSPRSAYACDCATVSTARAARDADVVFRGTVRSLREVGRGKDSRTDIRFAVDAVYKGVRSIEIRWWRRRGPGSVGLKPG